MIIAAILAALFAGSPTPRSEAGDAAKDIHALAATEQPHVRYLSTYAIPEADRPRAAKVLRFWANSLSRRKRLAFPTELTPTLYRVDLRDYDWKPEAWDALAEKDVYFRAPAVHPNSLEVLAYYSKAKYAILRADMFVARTCVEPDYSRFLELGKNVAEVKKQFSVQENDVDRLYLKLQGAVTQSIVALHNRQLQRQPSITGYWWESLDAKGNTGRQNVLGGGENLFAIKPDGGEFIWSLPNGLQGYYVANGQGEQVAEVPPDIARDSVTAFAKKTVVNARSCIACHDAGIRPFDDVISKMIRATRIKVVDPDKERALRLEELYLGNLGKKLKLDCDQYAEAVKACNELTTQENAKAFESVIYAFLEERVDLAAATRELGTDDAEKVFGRSLTGTLTVLLVGESIARDAWEEAWPEAATREYAEPAKGHP